jgi:hypothetical protein
MVVSALLFPVPSAAACLRARGLTSSAREVKFAVEVNVFVKIRDAELIARSAIPTVRMLATEQPACADLLQPATPRLSIGARRGCANAQS